MTANREGQPVPEVTFHTRKGAEWVDRTSKEIFANRTVIVFSLPGAFTPHLFLHPCAALQPVCAGFPQGGRGRDHLHVGQ